MPDPNQNTNTVNGQGMPGTGIASLYTSASPYAPGADHSSEVQGTGNAFSPAQQNPDGSFGDQTGGKMSTQQGQVYGGLFNQAQGMSGYFNNLAAGYNQQAPQIADAAQLAEAQKYYHDLMQGDGGYAQNQFRQSQDQSIAAQMAMANSARGGAAAHAGAQRAATQGAGQQMAAGANQAAQIAMQEEQQGAQGMQNIGTIETQRMSQNAQLQQNNQQQINQMMQALYGMGEQEQGLSLSAQQAYMANLLAAEGINTQQTQFNTQLGVQGAGAGLQAIAGGIGAAYSDANTKMEIAPQGRGGIASIDYSKSISTPAKPGLPDNAQAVGVGAGVGGGVGALAGGLSGGAAGALAQGALGAIQGGVGAAHNTRKDDPGLKAANVGISTGVGAAAGAGGGAAFGPIGAGVGAVVGGIGGLIKGLLT